MEDFQLIAILILGILSCIQSSILPLMYYNSQYCRQHPSLFLTLISTVEIIQTYHFILLIIGIEDVGDTLKLSNAIDFFTFGTMRSTQTQKLYFCVANETIYLTALSLQFVLYNCLSFDLVSVLKNPFQSERKRVMLYLMRTGVCMCFIFILIVKLTIENCQTALSNCQSNNNGKANNCSNKNYSLMSEYKSFFYPVQMIIITFIGVTVFSLYLGAKSLRESKDLLDEQTYRKKKKLIKQNELYCSILAIFWLVIFICIYVGSSVTLTYVSIFLILSQGFVVGSLRLGEKFFRERFLLLLSYWFTRNREENKQKILDYEKKVMESPESISLLSLLMQIQSQQSVTTILKSILYTFNNDFSNQEDLDKNSLNEYAIKIQTMTYEDSYSFRLSETFGDSIEFSLKEVNDQLELSKMQSHLSQSQSLAKVTVKIDIYSPKIFAALRKKNFGMSNDDARRSLSMSRNFLQIKNAEQSLGRSGAFFFFSWDSKLILKTINENEVEILQKRLSADYYTYIQDNPNCLMAKIYGYYSIHMQNTETQHFILMENTLDQNTFGQADRLYDLKGSLVSRFVKIPEGQSDLKKLVMKDVNFLQSDDLFIQMPADKREQITSQIISDTNFLKNHKIMDYSLLLGIRDITEKEVLEQKAEMSNEKSVDSQHEANYLKFKNPWRNFQSKDKKYSFSLIDYLQDYDCNKFFETQFKSIKNEKYFISSANPQIYQGRFERYIKQIFANQIDYE